MGKIRTFLIEDSGLMRIMISDVLRADPDFEVIGTAVNGKDGADKVSRLNPDVVITDMLMPEYDGIFAVKEIMKKNPVPIILLSSLKRTTPEIFDALNAGAFDFVDKPETKSSGDFKDSLSVLKERIRQACKLNTAALGKQVKKANHHSHTFASSLPYDIISIGASTGGPSAVESILQRLPENLPVPVVVAQHMPERFLESFSKRLDAIVPMKVTLAQAGRGLKPGTIYIMPGDGNMAIANSAEGPVFEYVKKEFKEFNNPSVNCVFESVSAVYRNKVIAVLLTGMGRDGATGMQTIKQNGGVTIAQDKATSVVYGMPQAAKRLNAVDYEVPLKEISGFITSCF